MEWGLGVMGEGWDTFMTVMQNLDLAAIKDCEDLAVGAGILSQNSAMFTDQEQVCAMSVSYVR